MYCNQPFSGNGFNNAQCFGYNTCNAPVSNSCLYPEIVGEGEVSSVSQPDGTFQLFFLPTLKWWTPHTANNYPYHTNIVNTNHNGPYCPYAGTNIGAWFVRTVTNLRSPLFTNTPCPRFEAPIPLYPSELNPVNNGYQIKFHHDASTSTTDIHYFYPRVRQFDCSLALPDQGCASVQVNTPITKNTVCHYEFVCSKPCHCTSKHRYVPVLEQAGSAMSLEDTKTTSNDICDCDSPSFTKPNKSYVKRRLKDNKITTSTSKHDNCENVGSRRMADTKPTSKELICECSIALPKSRKSNMNCSCCTCDAKNKRNAKSNKLVSECATLSSGKLNKSKQCKCCACGSNTQRDTISKTTSKKLICECGISSLSKHTTSKCACGLQGNISAISLADCKCSSPFPAKSNSNHKSVCCMTNVPDSKDDVQIQLLPTDVGRKRIKLEKPESASKSKSKDAICDCDLPLCLDKSIGTYTDNGGGPSINIQTPGCCDQGTEVMYENFVYRCEVVPEVWRPKTATSRKEFASQRKKNKLECSCCSSCTSYEDSD